MIHANAISAAAPSGSDLAATQTNVYVLGIFYMGIAAYLGGEKRIRPYSVIGCRDGRIWFEQMRVGSLVCAYCNS